MKLKYPKKIKILNETLKIKYYKDSFNGSVDLNKAVISIGTKGKTSYTFSVISHEISEAIHIILKTRYKDNSVDGNYKFFLDHKEFETHNNVFSKNISKFIK